MLTDVYYHASCLSHRSEGKTRHVWNFSLYQHEKYTGHICLPCNNRSFCRFLCKIIRLRNARYI